MMDEERKTACSETCNRFECRLQSEVLAVSPRVRIRCYVSEKGRRMHIHAVVGNTFVPVIPTLPYLTYV